MRRCVIKVQDEPISVTDNMTANIQELCGKVITVNMNSRCVYAQYNPELYCYFKKKDTMGTLLTSDEYTIIMENVIE